MPTTIKTVSISLRPPDLVMVIGIDPDKPAHAPRPGAIGEVSDLCWCLMLKEQVEGYRVDFSGNRTCCYRRTQLRKLGPDEPMGEDTERSRPREPVTQE